MAYLTPDSGGGSIPIPQAQTNASAPKPDTLGLRVSLAAIPHLTKPGLFPGGAFLFQAPPLEELTEQFAFNHADYAAWSGEFSRPQGRQLETLSFDTLWLDDGSSNHAPGWAMWKRAIDPIAAKERLKKILYAGSPVMLTAHQLPVWNKYDIRMMVTMRSLTSGEKHGEQDARYFSMQFREYRDATVRTKGMGAPHGVGKLGPNGKNVTVRNLPAGQDTLQELGKYYYGTNTAWQKIAKANGLHGVAGSTNLVAKFAKQPGKQLHLPPAKQPTKSRPKATGYGGRH